MVERPKENHQRKRRNVNIKSRQRLPSLLKHSQWKSGPSWSAVLQKVLLLETALWKPKEKVTQAFIQKIVPIPPQSLSLIMNQPVMVSAMSSWRSDIPQRKSWLKYQRKDPLWKPQLQTKWLQKLVFPLPASRTRPPEHHLLVQTLVQSQMTNVWCQRVPQCVLQIS